jgi:hypothetical protein
MNLGNFLISDEFDIKVYTPCYFHSSPLPLHLLP